MTEQTLERPAAPERRGAERDLTLDLIRTLATVFVISVHFMYRIGFYDQPMAGSRMLVMSMLRMGFMTCVPLFLLLTGYLCCEKELTPRYYLGLVRVLAVYVLCTAACILYRRVFWGEQPTLSQMLQGLLDFTGAPYGWYIEMYIGLFCLIPFLNLIWAGLKERWQKAALVVTLLALTSLPTLTNLHRAILPDWWMEIYPLTYYFLGAWSRTDPPRLRWPWLALGLLAGLAAGGVGQYLLPAGGAFIWTSFTDYAGPTVALTACALFLLLRRVPMERAPGWLRWLVERFSRLSLGIYLLSWCFDDFIYPRLAPWLPETIYAMPWYFVAVPAVFLGAALASQVVEWLRLGLARCLGRLFPRLGLK